MKKADNKMKINKEWIVKSFFEMVKFGFVGVLNTIAGLGGFFILLNVFHIQYVVSNTIGYSLGFINSFLWNKFWTFKSGGFSRMEVVLFFIVFIICFSIESGMLIYLKESVKLDIFWSQIIAMVVYTLLGFIGNKALTFNKDFTSYLKAFVSK